MCAKLMAVMVIGQFLLSIDACAIPAFALPGMQNMSSPACIQRYQVITVTEGDTFTINLHAQQASGYTWYITEPFIYDCVTLLSKTETVYRCPGGRGVATFTFQALNEGQEIIRFEYSKSCAWRPAEIRTYKIIIAPKKPLKLPIIKKNKCSCSLLIDMQK